MVQQQQKEDEIKSNAKLEFTHYETPPLPSIKVPWQFWHSSYPMSKHKEID
jgi:hypothetical protein